MSKRSLSWLCGTVVLVSVFVVAPGLAAAEEPQRGAGPLTPFSNCSADLPHEQSAAVYRICRPPFWWPRNNELVIWAHGYVDETQPIEIPEDQLCANPDLCLNDAFNFLGYDFATTSYATNGLAVLPGLADVIELVDLYTAYVGRPPGRVYLVGASEGGLITTLALEQRPDVFDGGLALCGPIGDFPSQINYFGDFRAIFDYYFPGLIPGDPTYIPPPLMDAWDEYYEQVVYPEVFDPANRDALRQLVLVSEAPYDLSDLRDTVETSIADLTWYSVFATNDGTEVLGGQPFDNVDRVYSGSDDDDALNLGIQRIAAEAAALAEMEANYQTTGVLTNPLVTLHTTLDQQVPRWHDLLYLEKTMASGSWPDKHFPYPPTEGYGHCLFAVDDVTGAFSQLVSMVTGSPVSPGLREGLARSLPEASRVLSLHPRR